MRALRVFDDFLERSNAWNYRVDNAAGFELRDSNLVLWMGPTEGDIYYSNAELSDGGFESLKWEYARAEFRAKLGMDHYGSAGFGFWNYSMVTELSMPIWFIYLNARGKYPLKGLFLQVVNQFMPVKLPEGSGLGAISIISRLFPGLAGAKVLGSRPLMQGLNPSEYHVYAVDWSERFVDFSIDGAQIARIPFVYKRQERRARVDVWIDNSVFLPDRNGPTGLYLHNPQENRKRHELLLDWIKIYE